MNSTIFSGFLMQQGIPIAAQESQGLRRAENREFAASFLDGATPIDEGTSTEAFEDLLALVEETAIVAEQTQADIPLLEAFGERVRAQDLESQRATFRDIFGVGHPVIMDTKHASVVSVMAEHASATPKENGTFEEFGRDDAVADHESFQNYDSTQSLKEFVQAGMSAVDGAKKATESTLKFPERNTIDGASVLALSGDVSRKVAPKSQDASGLASIDAKSVAAWTQAFENNDIRSIAFVADVPEAKSIARAQKAAVLSQTLALGEQAPEKIDTKSAAFAEAYHQDVVSEQVTKAPFVAEGNGDFVATQVQDKAKDAHRLEEIPQAPASEQEPGKLKQLQSAEPDNVARVVQASDLLLSNYAGEQSTLRTVTKPVLQNAAMLGADGDNRIPREALGFVADRIESLKQQGGGSLRLELQPRELGTVAIHVSMRSGRVQIRLDAERTTTLMGLQQNQGALLDALRTMGLEADLRLGTTVKSVGVAAHENVAGVFSSSMDRMDMHLGTEKHGHGFEASQSVMDQQNRVSDLRSALQSDGVGIELGPEASFVKTEARTDNSEKSFSTPSRSDQEKSQFSNRDNSREHGRQQWEEVFRRSA